MNPNRQAVLGPVGRPATTGRTGRCPWAWLGVKPASNVAISVDASKTMNKTLLSKTPAWLTLPLLAAMLIPLAGCGQAPVAAGTGAPQREAVEIDVAPVQRGHLTTTLDLMGTLIPVRATTIVPDVDGVIVAFPSSDRHVEMNVDGRPQRYALGIDIGHPVREGDELVRIDPSDFELDLKAAQAELELAKRTVEELLSWQRAEEVEQLAAALEEAKAARQKAEADLTRAEQLLKRRTISQAAYDEAQAAARMAAAKVRRAEAALKLAKAGPTEEEVAVAKAQVQAAESRVAQAQEKLDDTIIHAPYDGVITDRFVDVGDRVTAMPRVEIMQIIDPRILFAQVAVPERYQSSVDLDDMAEVTAEGIEQSFTGRVNLINAKIDPETRTFRARVTVDNRAGKLKAGGFVHVSLPIDTAGDVLLVPRRAVTFDEGRPSVFVHHGGRVERVPVKLGLADDALYEVTAGLKAGQEVAVTKTALLADGMRVEIGDEDAADAQ